MPINKGWMLGTRAGLIMQGNRARFDDAGYQSWL